MPIQLKQNTNKLKQTKHTKHIIPQTTTNKIKLQSTYKHSHITNHSKPKAKITNTKKIPTKHNLKTTKKMKQHIATETTQTKTKTNDKHAENKLINQQITKTKLYE